MDSLLQLIDNQIDKAMSKSAHINSQIAQVISTDGATATVKLFTIGTEYALPNYSGSEIRAGDTVYIYWRGGFFSPQSAYIGASTRSDFPIAYIYGTDTVGAMATANAEIQVENVIADCTVNLVFNAVITATTAGNYTLTIYVDNVAETYSPTGTTIANGYVNCNFTIPLNLGITDNHVIEVRTSGTGTVTQMKSYVYGQGIREGGTNG